MVVTARSRFECLQVPRKRSKEPSEVGQGWQNDMTRLRVCSGLLLASALQSLPNLAAVSFGEFWGPGRLGRYCVTAGPSSKQGMVPNTRSLARGLDSIIE